MPLRDTVPFANLIDDLYSAIFESSKIVEGRQLTAATIFSEVAGVSIDGVLFYQPAYLRVYEDLTHNNSGTLHFDNDGFWQEGGSVVSYLSGVLASNDLFLAARLSLAPTFTGQATLFEYEDYAPGISRITVSPSTVSAIVGRTSEDLSVSALGDITILIGFRTGDPSDRGFFSLNEDAPVIRTVNHQAASRMLSAFTLGSLANGNSPLSSTAQLRWLLIADEVPSTFEITSIHSLPNDLTGSGTLETLLAIGDVVSPGFASRLTFCWKAGSLEHTPVATVGDGLIYEPAEAIATSPMLGKVGTVSPTTGTQRVVLDWPDLTDADSYTIQWKSGTQAYNTSNRQQTTTDSELTLSSLMNGTAYTFRVRGTAANFTDGDWSDEVSATPALPVLGKTATPTSTAGRNQVTLDWPDLADVTRYIVQWKSGSEVYTTARLRAPSSSTVVIDSLTLGVTYTFRVRGTAAGFTDGAWSDEVSVSTFANLTEMSRYNRGTPRGSSTLAQYHAQCVAANQISGFVPPDPITSDFTAPVGDHYIIRQRFLLRTDKRWNQVTLHLPDGVDDIEQVYILQSDPAGTIKSAEIGEVGHYTWTPNPQTINRDLTLANWGSRNADGYYYFYLEAYFVEGGGGQQAGWRLGYRDEDGTTVAPKIVTASFV